MDFNIDLSHSLLVFVQILAKHLVPMARFLCEPFFKLATGWYFVDRVTLEHLELSG